MVERKGSGTRSTVMNHGQSIVSKRPAEPLEKLVLDQTNIRPTRTRTQLYKELNEGQSEGEEDHYEYSPPPLRAIALMIDILFMFIMANLLFYLVPLEIKLIDVFMAKYSLQFMFGETVLIYILKSLNIAFGLFFFVIIPTSFFNTSLGKKITNQRVRGDYKYTLSISQAIQRELIWKPLGMAFLVGFFMPFFDKKKKSLHDKLTGTIVVRD